MYAGNMRYVKWIVDGLSAIAATFVAFLAYFLGFLGYSILIGDMDLDMAADTVVEALNEPLFWFQGMTFWSPAALLGFGTTARLIGRKRPSLFVTAPVAASSSFLFGLMIGGAVVLLIVTLNNA